MIHPDFNMTLEYCPRCGESPEAAKALRLARVFVAYGGSMKRAAAAIDAAAMELRYAVARLGEVSGKTQLGSLWKDVK